MAKKGKEGQSYSFSGDGGQGSLRELLNTNILRRAQAYLKENPSTVLLVVGRKARDFFKRREVPIRREWIQVFPEVSFEKVKEIAGKIDRIYSLEPTLRVEVLYNEFKNVIQQKVTVDTLLPIEPQNSPSRSGGSFDRGRYAVRAG